MKSNTYTENVPAIPTDKGLRISFDLSTKSNIIYWITLVAFKIDLNITRLNIVLLISLYTVQLKKNRKWSLTLIIDKIRDGFIYNIKLINDTTVHFVTMNDDLYDVPVPYDVVDEIEYGYIMSGVRFSSVKFKFVTFPAICQIIKTIYTIDFINWWNLCSFLKKKEINKSANVQE